MGNVYEQSDLNKSRKDKFTLNIPIPEGLKEYNKKYLRKHAFMNLDSLVFSVYGSIVPDNSVPAVEAPYSGGNVYVSSHSRPKYDPVTVNYTIDNQFNNYWAINSWINWMRDEKSGIYSGKLLDKDKGLGQYSTTFMLVAKDEYHNDVIQWNYKGAFPTTQKGIEYNYRDAGEIESSFTFVFHKIESELISLE